MKNYYPDKPLMAYKKTPIEMSVAIGAMKDLNVPLEVKRSTYIIFRNESANGKSGFNNNFGGIQTDSGRWSKEYDQLIIGTVNVKENRTGLIRGFAVFESPFTFLEMLSDRLYKRGIYIGGDTYHVVKQHVDTVDELALIYKREWVTGKADAQFEVTIDKNGEKRLMELENFRSMYSQAEKIFTA